MSLSKLLLSTGELRSDPSLCRLTNIVIICRQNYAQQLQENERRLAELMRVERELRHHHGGSTPQQYDVDYRQQGKHPLYSTMKFIS